VPRKLLAVNGINDLAVRFSVNITRRYVTIREARMVFLRST